MTYETLENPTPQEIFDTSVNHMRKQKIPAIASSGVIQCVYRSQEGLACAVGCLVDDELARKFDNSVWSSISRLAELIQVPEWIKENVALLTSLQSVHDGNPVLFGEVFEKHIKNIALNHNLVYTAP